MKKTLFVITGIFLLLIAGCSNSSSDPNYIRKNGYPEDVKIEGMMWVPQGEFWMGSTNNEQPGDNLHAPPHKVTLNGFFMAEYQVTQKKWQDVTGMSIQDQLDKKKSQTGEPWHSLYGIGDNNPVYYVNWYEAVVFCNKLSIQENLTPVYSKEFAGIYYTDPDKWGLIPDTDDPVWNTIKMNIKANGYRLPTEAEWEYAARGGSKSKGYRYSGSDNADDVGWYDSIGGIATKGVGLKMANELGLFDMSGNVFEWCWDWYKGPYSSDAEDNPVGPDRQGTDGRIFRGGGFWHDLHYLRTWKRESFTPEMRDFTTGFRVVRSSP